MTALLLALSPGLIAGQGLDECCGAAEQPAGRETRLQGPDAVMHLTLADGRLARLAEIMVPDEATLLERARDRVANFSDRPGVAAVELGRDRHGRALVRLGQPEGRSLQEELIAQGLAYVGPDPSGPARAALLTLEETARRERAGLWAIPALAEQRAERITATPLRFAVVRGRVASVTERERWTYLDFGADWRTDFTVRMLTVNAKAWRRRGLDTRKLAERELRVRGWVMALSGPMIEVAEEGQIEVLE